MGERPNLTANLDSDTFQSYYYLKEELVAFCREQQLQTTGGKAELTGRIAAYLATGERKTSTLQKKAPAEIGELSPESVIEENFVCSERHRAFFKAAIGKGFSFNVPFQTWLKENAGKTYQDAIEAYRQLLAAKKQGETKIDKQFEYNTYIRAFFKENEGKTLQDAICCWNYKRGQKGHYRYERADLIALK